MTDLFTPLRDGTKCPCCGQFVKTYARKLNSSMSRVLILIYRSGKKEPFHVENWLKEINKPELRADFHKLRLWGLLRKKNENREDGSARNGFYNITGTGIMFVEGKLKVKEKVLIYNNKVEGFEGNEVTIHETLGNKFNYQELMKD